MSIFKWLLQIALFAVSSMGFAGGELPPSKAALCITAFSFTRRLEDTSRAYQHLLDLRERLGLSNVAEPGTPTVDLSVISRYSPKKADKMASRVKGIEKQIHNPEGFPGQTLKGFTLKGKKEIEDFLDAWENLARAYHDTDPRHVNLPSGISPQESRKLDDALGHILGAFGCSVFGPGTVATLIVGGPGELGVAGVCGVAAAFSLDVLIGSMTSYGTKLLRQMAAIKTMLQQERRAGWLYYGWNDHLTKKSIEGVEKQGINNADIEGQQLAKYFYQRAYDHYIEYRNRGKNPDAHNLRKFYGDLVFSQNPETGEPTMSLVVRTSSNPLEYKVLAKKGSGSGSLAPAEQGEQ